MKAYKEFRTEIVFIILMIVTAVIVTGAIIYSQWLSGVTEDYVPAAESETPKE
jgi:cell division protein FtsL